MQLDPSNPNNFNGFIHPDYIDHIEPLIKNCEVTIHDAEIPNTDVIDWARKGYLNSLTTDGGSTSMSGLVIVGEGYRFIDYLSGHKPSFDRWLNDYYLGSPEQSIGSLMSIMADSFDMNPCTEVVAAICIQDLGFHETDELTAFLMDNVHPKVGEYLERRLSELFKHYLSTDEAIEAYEDQMSLDPYRHIEYAKLWAKMGAESRVRRHLEQAERLAGMDSDVWRWISIQYLKLMGDFEASRVTRNRQVESANKSYHITQAAFDLLFFIGADEAITEGQELMQRAETIACTGSEYSDLAYVWGEYFGDKDRANKFNKLAIDHGTKPWAV